jgi:hypothetical protein
VFVQQTSTVFFASLPQEVGGTLIWEDGLVIMAGAELVERYQIHGFHEFDAVPAIIMSHSPLISLQLTTLTTCSYHLFADQNNSVNVLTFFRSV